MSLPARARPHQAAAKSPTTNAERAERIKAILADSEAHNTREAKRNDLAGLAAWQEAQGLTPGLPLAPDEFLAWLDWLAHEAIDPRKGGKVGFSTSTVERKAHTVSATHKRLGYESPISDPTVAAWLLALPKRKAPEKHARPLRIEDLCNVLRVLAVEERNQAYKARDRALLLVGFSAALRRSEIIGLDVADVEPAPKGAIVRVRRSKTDQAGEGVAIPIYRRTIYCPVGAVRDWLKLRAEQSEGAIPSDAPLFVGVNRGGGVKASRMCARNVDVIVKARCEAAGLVGYSAHSLRAGYCVSSREAGSTEFSIRRTTRHKSVASLHRYFSGAGIFDEDPFAQFDQEQANR